MSRLNQPEIEEAQRLDEYRSRYKERQARRIRRGWIRFAIHMILLILIGILIIGNLWNIQVMQTDALDQIQSLRLEVWAEQKHEPEEPAPAEPVSLGTFTVTHYCSCPICCGKSDGITATGTMATEGRTIAVDPNVIPLGSEVLIDGQVYIAEDVGGAIKGNKVDIYVSSHQEAINRGKFEREVRIYENH